jgi:hypothetical protein
MKASSLMGLGILILGIVLLHKSRKKKVRKDLNEKIVLRPTAIFIWQGSSKKPKIDLYP